MNTLSDDVPSGQTIPELSGRTPQPYELEKTDTGELEPVKGAAEVGMEGHGREARTEKAHIDTTGPGVKSTCEKENKLGGDAATE
ncbi:hypothetical protein CEUSTIGMA_g6324.t1 [Chlamydomonas eustigma]|uniref:Uncharacterized protein n=1 Tax=Chlamydomonas eustigma TaxID=1157962 RepID=A0A250X745_9CHLO|nr:hypothetical protein CEUSTIGMA_g6324.t1 [Chlamydomonas eustigma]|eukprot:GAX78885.1 hypothetical protein CEUSTIGMA_g6324.t1 [Chlamydomonas eustigma]